MTWKTIRGRRVNVRRGNRRKARRRDEGRIRFFFGRERTPAEHEAHEREVARKRETKARLKAIRAESKARARAYRDIGKERAKDERIRILRESEGGH
jgi:hypothetical protein